MAAVASLTRCNHGSVTTTVSEPERLDRRRRLGRKWDVVAGIITDRRQMIQADSQELIPVRGSATWHCP